MRFQSIQKHAFFQALALTIALATFLMLGFIPTSKSLFLWFKPWIPATYPHFMLLKEMSFFPLLAALFALTLPKRYEESIPVPRCHLLKISLLPVLIALLFGHLRQAPYDWASQMGSVEAVWYVVFIPLGEEFLFRGWFYGVIHRIWPKFLSATNPLPVAIWMSALAFSIWHLQNLNSTPLPLVGFQVLYTFCTGIWLGYLRWTSGKIYPAIMAHFSINFVSGIGL